MTKTIKPILMIVITLLCVLSMFSLNYAEEVVTGTVIDKNAVLMKEPKISAQSLNHLALGEEVFIEGNHGKWYQISTRNGLFGWMHSECILVDAGEKDPIENGIVNAGSVDVYEKPEIEAGISGKLGFSTKIVVVKKDADWYQVAMGDEIIGWVHSESILTTPIHKKAKIMAENGEVRSEASRNSKIIKNLEKNDKIKINGFKESYFHITWGEKEEGWIYSSEVSLIHEEFFNGVFVAKDKQKKFIEKEENEENSVQTFEDIIENATDLGDGYSATAYDLSIASCGKAVGAKHRGFTRTGYNLNGKSWEDAMIVAVDSRTIPLGSRVLILFDESDWRARYNGIYLAADTGGGVKGKTIDLYLGDIGNQQMKEVKDFGKTDNVKVYLLN
ncbi:3D domain-containing protein [Marinisporobacter balticus]|uniref:3D (Asp-Asp-Asp) domain-containing protein n=1 Tax=Marinisporobacter balticus TaxID=2018667 RepID=A0A4R2KX44_9FIRM|nr:3D domain-containing protein [Marinisporobacter balticus]TCO77447.1 3D (Asp-Asp-Asp) domain-containing protein [Marinisporobacter balticus]